MGKTEKIVVLSFLFVIAVLFVWSLDHGDGIEAAGDDARDAARHEGAQQDSIEGDGGARSPAADPSKAGVGVQAPEGRGVRPSADSTGGGQPGAASDSGPMLIAEIEDEPASQIPNSAAIVLLPEWDLRIVRGLQRTLDPEVFAAVAGADDTWESIAELYYGDAGKERLLRRSNEGTALEPGVTVLLPAVDRLPLQPEIREIEVLDGEGLWHVAERVYGSGAKWMKIYEANRDRLPNKDVVRPGTLLRIPALDESAN